MLDRSASDVEALWSRCFRTKFEVPAAYAVFSHASACDVEAADTLAEEASVSEFLIAVSLGGWGLRQQSKLKRGVQAGPLRSEDRWTKVCDEVGGELGG